MSEEWTPERIKMLGELWEAGLSTGEIGKRLGVTKNAVVGKVHRLGLPKRPSPIKRGAPAAAAKKPAKARKAEAKPKVVTLGTLKSGMCSWPMGDPGTPEFRFCGSQVVAGKPYCADHCSVAYVRSSKDRPRGDDAPARPAAAASSETEAA